MKRYLTFLEIAIHKQNGICVTKKNESSISIFGFVWMNQNQNRVMLKYLDYTGSGVCFKVPMHRNF